MKTGGLQKSKNKTALFLALAMLSSIVNVSDSTAAVRIGDKCTKVNQVARVGSVKLICVRVDKSLQWDKTLFPITYAYGPAGRLRYQYVDGKQQRLAANKQWSLSDKRSQANFHPIRVAAYKSIRSLKKDPALSNITFDYLIQPDFPRDIAAAIKKQSAETASYLSPLINKNLEIKLILVTEKDTKFIQDDLNVLIPNPDWLGQLKILDDYGSLRTFYSRSGTGGGTGFYLRDRGYAYYLGHTSSFATLETYWPQVAPHEMAHVIQATLANGLDPATQEFSEGHPQAKWAGHLIEGSANTLGMAIGFNHLGWYSDEMDFLLWKDIQVFESDVKMKTVKDAVNLMKRLEKRSDDLSNNLSYSAGQFIWEYFVGKYGASKLMELFANIPITENFNENIKSTIGITNEQFYKEAAPYLLSAWKRLG